MSVSANCFLELAKSHSNSTDEMSKRCSVSKAYYAAFHLAQSIFPSRERVDGYGLHKSYFEYLLKQPAGSKERALGVKLNTMHSKRVKADYIIHEDIPTNYTATQIHAADEVFKLLQP